MENLQKPWYLKIIQRKLQKKSDNFWATCIDKGKKKKEKKKTLENHDMTEPSVATLHVPIYFFVFCSFPSSKLG